VTDRAAEVRDWLDRRTDEMAELLERLERAQH
jgi:hypothetical protein